ncbi:MAG: hypothetical protein MJY47_05285 [Fibrobacter sp.]|nr:hypothetical protein [Fibrobacter sp.]
MKKMVRAVLFAMMAVFSTAVFAEDEDPCAMPANLTEIEGVYQIGTCGDLYKFAEMVNGGETGINGRLTADICLNACGEGESVLKANGTLSDNASNFTQWTPIGTSEKPYTGTFDGNGHTIRGLYVNDGDAEYVGLFGYIDESAKVQNVGVVDSYFKGSLYVGGVVGYNDDGTVSNVYNAGAVNGEWYVGGVVGFNYDGTVSNVYNTGSVSGYYEVGGVVGYNMDGSVSNVYNTGSVSGTGNHVGGVVGYSLDGTVSNVYNTGIVSGKTYVGGVVGDNAGSEVNKAYYDEQTCNNCNSYGTGKTLAELATLTIGSKADDDADFPLLKGETESPWAKGIYYDKATGKLANSELPYLKSLPKPQDVEMEFNVKDNVIQISSTDDLKNFARLVSEFGVTDVDAELTADICLNACGEGESVLKADGTLNDADTSKFVKWTPIGTDANSFAGTFDGDGKTISGLYFNDETMELVGLFGMAEKATIKNVGVVDSYFSGSGAVGAVAGIVFDSEVSNVYSESVVSASDGFVGGIVGINDGEVTESYNKGSVSGRENVGGIVGINAGKVTSSYNAGTVSGEEIIGGIVGGNDGGTISNVLNMGSVIGTEDVGGIVGGTWNGSISDCYFDKTIYDGKAIGDNGGEEIDESDFGKTSDELVAGTSLKLDTTVWVLGAVSENVKQDTLYYPYLKVFGPHKYELGDVKKYAITVAVNDKTMGTVTGAGTYEYGTDVEISATAKKGYKFVKWSDGVKDAKRTITVTKAEKLTATFEKDSKKDAVVAMAQLPQFSVTASGKMVSIAGARPNSIVNVFDMQGNRVKTVVATAANFTFALPSAGVYIVKNGYTAKRVNVR